MTPPAIAFSVFTKLWNEPLPVLASRLKALGVEGVELPVRPGFAVEPARVQSDLPAAARRFADDGLRIFSIAPPVELPIDERLVAACAEAGVPVIRVMVRIDERGYLACEAAAREAIVKLTPTLLAHQVRLGVQNHYAGFVANAAGLSRLVEGLDPSAVRSVYDVGHCGLNGEVPELAVDLLWSHLGMINLKNMVWERTGTSDRGAAVWRKRVVAGRDGLASWPDAARHLRGRGYSGVVTICAEFDDLARKDALLEDDLRFARALFLQ